LRRSSRTSRLVLLVAYGIYLTVLWGHAAAELPARSHPGNLMQDYQAAVRLACNEPCNDPSHHHQRSPHRLGYCVICQSYAVSYLTLWSFHVDLTCTHELVPLPSDGTVLSVVGRFWPDAPRGPPAAAA